MAKNSKEDNFISREKRNGEVIVEEVNQSTNIVLNDKDTHEKINEDELYREVLIYKVNEKTAYIMAVIEHDEVVRAYNMDADSYFNYENQEDYSDKVPDDILEELVRLACEQITVDYKKSTEKTE